MKQDGRLSLYLFTLFLFVFSLSASAQTPGIHSLDLGYSSRTYTHDYSNTSSPGTNEITSNLLHIHTHSSLLDVFLQGTENKLRIGDYLGVDADLGSWNNTYTSASEPNKKTVSEGMYLFGLAWGIQGSYSLNSEIGVGARYYFYAETEAGHNSDYANRAMKFLSLFGNFGPFFGEAAFGSPYDFSDAWKQYGKDSSFKLDVKYLFEDGYSVGLGYSKSTKDLSSKYPDGGFQKPKEEPTYKQYFINLGVLI